MAEMIRYLAAGVVNTIVGYGVFLVSLNFIGLNAYYSNAASYAVGLIVAYFISLGFVFKDSSHSTRAVYRFVSGFMVSYGVNILVLNSMISYFGFQPEIAQIFAMTAYTVCFYVINRYFVWVR